MQKCPWVFFEGLLYILYLYHSVYIYTHTYICVCLSLYLSVYLYIFWHESCFWFRSLLFLSSLVLFRLLSPCRCMACICFQEDGGNGRTSSQCLVAGLLTVARTHRAVVQAALSFRVLESGSDPQTHVGSTQSIWQWQQPDMCIPRGVRAKMGGAWL